MSLLRHVEWIMIPALLLSAPALFAQEESPSREASRPQLVRQLSDALHAFDHGSALLKRAPDEALSAFRQAGDQFQRVVDAGIENGQLYYNLGNTHLRLGEIGRAIAAYRRAQRLKLARKDESAHIARG